MLRRSGGEGLLLPRPAPPPLPPRLARALEAMLQQHPHSVPHPDILPYYSVTLQRQTSHKFQVCFFPAQKSLEKALDFQVAFFDLALRFNEAARQFDATESLQLFTHILANLLSVLAQHLHKRTLLRLVFRNVQLRSVVSTPFVALESFTLDLFLHQLSRCIQSAEEWTLGNGEDSILNLIVRWAPEDASSARLRIE